MRNMIKADLRRILKKPSLYVWLVIMGVFFFLFSGYTDYTADTLDQEYKCLMLAAPIIISIPVFLSVYGDEMKCGAMQCIIGRGTSRTKVLLGKYLECLILSLFYFAFLELTMFGRNRLWEVGTSRSQDLTLAFFIVMIYVRTAGYFAFASFFVFLSWSTAPGVVALLTLTSFADAVLKMVQMLANINVYDYSFGGLLDAAYADLQVGGPGLTLIPAVVIFIGGALLAAALIFGKKEIEF
ncbi:MAG: hypothetical protein Q4A32_07640 [Lachnospiraceae bacterium]|nr:hypothetical protein [Lachnospiraceae bacterium]